MLSVYFSRVQWCALGLNTGSIRTAEKIGFRHECTLENWYSLAPPKSGRKVEGSDIGVDDKWIGVITLTDWQRRLKTLAEARIR